LIVGADRRPTLRAFGRKFAVVDQHLGQRGVFARHEVAGSGEKRHRLKVEAVEETRPLRIGAARTAEALLEEREERKRVAAVVADRNEFRGSRRDEIDQSHAAESLRGLVQSSLLGPAKRAHRADAVRMGKPRARRGAVPPRAA